MSTCQFSALMKKNLFHFLSIIACAMGMKRYVEANISLKSHTTVKYFMKMWSSVSDTLIFIFLGVSTIGENHEWNWPYICFTVIFCLIWRALGMVKSCFFWWLFEWNIQFCEMGECFCSQHHPLLFPCVWLLQMWTQGLERAAPADVSPPPELLSGSKPSHAPYSNFLPCATTTDSAGAK